MFDTLGLLGLHTTSTQLDYMQYRSIASIHRKVWGSAPEELIPRILTVCQGRSQVKATPNPLALRKKL